MTKLTRFGGRRWGSGACHHCARCILPYADRLELRHGVFAERNTICRIVIQVTDRNRWLLYGANLVCGFARTPLESLRGTRSGDGYDPMERPDRSRRLRNGGTFYSVVVSWFSRTYELEVLAARPLTMVLRACLRGRVAPFAVVGPAVQGRAATSFGLVGTTVEGEGCHLRRGRKRPP